MTGTTVRSEMISGDANLIGNTPLETLMHENLCELGPPVFSDDDREVAAGFQRTLQVDFAIGKPTIAVLGLNPHAGESGRIGMEEEEIIRPAIIEAKKSGMMVMGPYPADGFFGAMQHTKFDAVLAMYHDQGLVPFKALSFGGGVNFTAGLPVVRTSPDHGTAPGLAGRNEASPDSFRQAVYLACDIWKNRLEYDEANANPLAFSSRSADR